ncbi:hypothetical protein DVH05_008909 [Phytophthora capsici]|nr:hypothetical protein DVH05_008909 [Phytophthora capsici]
MIAYSSNRENGGVLYLYDFCGTSRKASEPSVALSTCDKNTSKSIFTFKRVTSYEEKPVDPPQECIDAITTEYQKNVMSWTLPSDLTEKERCAFAESILTNCIASINTKIREECKKGEKVD